jgi:hypothetical protein
MHYVFQLQAEEIFIVLKSVILLKHIKDILFKSIPQASIAYKLLLGTCFPTDGKPLLTTSQLTTGICELACNNT